ncbi:MAG: hypothetical protein E7036_08010 [Opitutales bacterium]|nr:hypothetical protein [Opitutales bacterium]
MKLAKTVITASALMFGVVAFGAGFQVQEQGASNMGTSMAGAVTNANNDASAAFNNASAFAFSDLEAGKSIASIGMSLVIPTLGLNKDDGTNYPCAVKSFVPNFFFGHKFTEDLSAMLSITAPFGLESDYEDNFIPVGGTQGMNSYLLTMDVNPTLVYKVNDWFSINGGISAQYAYCKLTSEIPMGPMGMNEMKLSGQGWGVGGNIGFTVQYMEGGRFGFHWRSAVQQDLSGTARYAGNELGDIDASVKMPDTFTFGVYQRLPGWFDNFAVMADYTYTRWSTFQELPVSGAVNMVCPENWKDTSRVSLGVHYYPEDFKKLILRAGVAFDESPVRDAINRTVRIPCSDRVWYSFGFGYQLADNISLDMSYVYIMTVGNSDINRTENGMHVEGWYYGHIHVISAQLNFTF